MIDELEMRELTAAEIGEVSGGGWECSIEITCDDDGNCTTSLKCTYKHEN